MRVAVLAMLAMSACGCIGNVEQGNLGMTLAEAVAVGQDVAPASFLLTRAWAAMPLDEGLAFDGTANLWTLRFEDRAETKYADVKVTARGARIIEEGKMQEKQGNGAFVSNAGDPWQYDCPTDWRLDSPELARQLVLSLQWAHVWKEGQIAQWPGASKQLEVNVQLECLAQAKFWSVSTPFMKNEDGSMSVRSFMLDLDGVLAGFTDGKFAGGHSVGSTGLSVDVEMIDTDWGLATTSGSATFETGGSTRLVVRADIGNERVPLIGQDIAFRVTDPAGSVHEFAYDGLSGTTWVQLEMLDVAPLAATGTWTIEAEASLPAVLANVRLSTCTGIAFKPLGSFPACDALVRPA